MESVLLICLLIALLAINMASFYFIFIKSKKEEKFTSSNGILDEDTDYPCFLPEDHLAWQLTFCEKCSGEKEKGDCYKKCWNNSPALQNGYYPNLTKTISRYL